MADGRLWAIGGEIGLNGIDSVEISNPESGEWTDGPPLPNAERRHGPVAVSMDGASYVAGGPFPPGATATDSVIGLDNPSRAYRF